MNSDVHLILKMGENERIWKQRALEFRLFLFLDEQMENCHEHFSNVLKQEQSMWMDVYI